MSKERWVYRVHAYHPPRQDAIEFYVLRYGSKRGTTQYLFPTDEAWEWKHLPEGCLMEGPAVSIPGIRVMTLDKGARKELLNALDLLNIQLGERQVSLNA